MIPYVPGVFMSNSMLKRLAFLSELLSPQSPSIEPPPVAPYAGAGNDLVFADNMAAAIGSGAHRGIVRHEGPIGEIICAMSGDAPFSPCLS